MTKSLSAFRAALAALALLCLQAAPTPALAQTSAGSGAADLDAERDRLAKERQTMEATYESDRRACYKKFAVQGCLEDSRARRRVTNDDLRRQEAALNDIERQRRGADEQKKLDEKAADARAADAEAKRQDSLKAQQDREQRATDHAASRAQTAADAAEQKRRFEQKQQDHQDDLAKQARERAAEPANVQDYQNKLKKADQQRADLERRNAANTKPRSAPLPDPPPADAAAPRRPLVTPP